MNTQTFEAYTVYKKMLGAQRHSIAKMTDSRTVSNVTRDEIFIS